MVESDAARRSGDRDYFGGRGGVDDLEEAVRGVKRARPPILSDEQVARIRRNTDRDKKPEPYIAKYSSLADEIVAFVLAKKVSRGNGEYCCRGHWKKRLRDDSRWCPTCANTALRLRKLIRGTSLPNLQDWVLPRKSP